MTLNFQMSVMLISVVLLILSLTLIGLSLQKQKYNVEFPPVIADCPDYWTNKSDEEGVKCLNVKKLGSENCKDEINFSRPRWIGNPGLCNKQKWAHDCGITWDGITNNPKVCQV